MKYDDIKPAEYHKLRVHEHTLKRTRTYKEEWKQVKWSRDFDGMSIIVLMAYRPKMTVAELRNVITNEGGRIDDQGIIHRG